MHSLCSHIKSWRKISGSKLDMLGANTEMGSDVTRHVLTIFHSARSCRAQLASGWVQALQAIQSDTISVAVRSD